MKRIAPALLAAASLACAEGVATNGVVAALRAPYQTVRSLAAETRRTAALPNGKTVRTLSTVYFKRPDHFHAETVSPMRRRVIADGSTLKIHIDGMPTGGVSPIDGLGAEMLANMRAVPGSPESVLMAFDGAAEASFPPDAGFSAKVGCKAEDSYAVLDIDALGRLARMAVYESPEMKSERIRFAFDDYMEAAPGVWIARRHTTFATFDGKAFTDTLRLSNLSVNEPVADSLFQPDAFFPGVKFEPLR